MVSCFCGLPGDYHVVPLDMEPAIYKIPDYLVMHFAYTLVMDALMVPARDDYLADHL